MEQTGVQNGLRRRRKALGLTQGELAERLTATKATISDWERDKFKVRHPGMLDLALQTLEAKWRPGHEA